MTDSVILVDKEDRVIGTMEKIEAHKGEGVLHRAVSVFLFNREGKLLIQKRSDKKIVGALLWANTCCGNVRPKETYLGCARRRLKEELGIKDVRLKKVTKFTYQVRCNEVFSEHEMDTVFVGTFEGSVIPDPFEVIDYQWIGWDDFIKKTHTASENNFVPWVQIMQNEGITDRIYERNS